MLSSVLRSPRAVLVNVEIMRTFVRLREMLATNVVLARKLAALESKYDAQFKVVFDAIRELMTPAVPTRRRQIGFVTPEPSQQRCSRLVIDDRAIRALANQGETHYRYAMPRATQAIIGVNVVVFLLQMSLGDEAIVWFALWPLNASAVFGPEVGFAPWQLVTYSFLHGGFTHVFFNMFAVYTFGSALEQFFGTRWYVMLYFVSVVTAGLAQLGVSALMGSPYPTLGASGGVFGLLLVPMPAWVAVTGYGALELFLGVTGTQAGVAHFAHLGGMLGAFVMIQWRRGKPPFAKRRR